MKVSLDTLVTLKSIGMKKKSYKKLYYQSCGRILVICIYSKYITRKETTYMWYLWENRGLPKELIEVREYLERTFILNGLIFLTWKDKRLVRVILKIHNVSMSTEKKKRNSTDDLIKPACIIEYNNSWKKSIMRTSLFSLKFFGIWGDAKACCCGFFWQTGDKEEFICALDFFTYASCWIDPKCRRTWTFLWF